MAAKELGGLKVLTANRSGLDANEMRRMGDFLRDKEPGVVGVLASINGEKVSLLAVCGKEAVAKGIKAGDIIKAIAPIVRRPRRRQARQRHGRRHGAAEDRRRARRGRRLRGREARPVTTDSF